MRFGRVFQRPEFHRMLEKRDVISSIQSETIMQKSCRAFSSGDGDLVDAVVPFMGESISDGTLATFLKKPGDRVAADEPIAQIETDKVTIDVSSPQDGVLQEYVAKEGDTVEPGNRIAVISKSAEGVAPAAPAEKKSEKAASEPSPAETVEKPKTPSYDEGDLVDAVVPFMGESISDGTLATFLKKPGDRVAADEPIAQIETDKVTIDVTSPQDGVLQEYVAKEGDTVEPGNRIAVISKSAEGVAPAASAEKKSEKAASKPSPPTETVKEDKPKAKVETSPSVEKPRAPSPPPPKRTATEPILPPKERERRVPMTRLRKRVATRLKDSQNTFAMLTTFNEVDMTNLMKLRSDYKDAFVEKHGVKLGFMSGFVKAAVSALQHQPIVNAVIDGDDIIYRDYIDISIAVGTPKGLVVPVVRDADKMNFAEIEKTINSLAKKANDGTISIDEMAGGSFTISNGGVYGSLLSTPIINPPQSAILGMHSIVSRPMVVGGNVVPRPMMYVALTYDHRLIDGREAVFFLRRIKDVVEDPRRLLLDV
ncbi:dihydrolipoyllysine-residue succinyltransferase component of 2-oxoglutarate dehydrogenase complex 2, mitochondrial-like isoform X2 [Durio zibethinus]|uniref:dihydrolipoyllysine-residue succinyltransferase n=1 Tax=Durio zibethinus TaxID=66656 RepID=A0A6P5ZJY2_DURZI|nr:dihydrolipoyllysine-residue succinyltransferase component of 2-oxoglutarate dehydrogenase complex 2, mitochondrial-like isoform X2 [Durio zibethinus]